MATFYWEISYKYIYKLNKRINPNIYEVNVVINYITFFKIPQQHFQRINPQQQFVRYNVNLFFMSFVDFDR